MTSRGQIKVKCWEAFLKSRNCTPNRINASHHIWKCPKCLQGIVFQGANKEIPLFHISTNLRTMKIPKAEFFAWVDQNC